jgi:hypothetical protein
MTSSILTPSATLLNLGVNYFKFKSVDYIKENSLCHSLNLSNIFLDWRYLNPELPLMRVISGLSQDLFSSMEPAAAEYIKEGVAIVLSDLALIPVQWTIKKIQMKAFKKFFSHEYSFLAVVTRIALSSFIIAVANYQPAIDYDTRHHPNYLYDPAMTNFVDNIVCKYQSSLDARGVSAFLGTVAHGILYEATRNYITSWSGNVCTNIVLMFYLQNSYLYRHMYNYN